jgi:hypothetical protein
LPSPHPTVRNCIMTSRVTNDYSCKNLKRTSDKWARNME